MIFRFNCNPFYARFIFRAPSVEKAQEFICSIYDRFSMDPNDGCDWVGNYLSLLSTDGDNGFTPICEVL